MRTISIRDLGKLRLVRPLAVRVEPDGDDFLATLVDLDRVCGIGKDGGEALTDLKERLEELWREFNEDDLKYSRYWTEARRFMESVVAR